MRRTVIRFDLICVELLDRRSGEFQPFRFTPVYEIIGNGSPDAAITVSDAIPVLLIDGDPHLDETRSETFFAAAALRGELFQNLADALTHLHVPTRIRPDDDETIASVETTNPPVYRQLIVPAQQHFRACMDMARETRNYGEHSDRCADGLARYEPRWRRPVELRPRAGQRTRLVHPEAY